MKSIYRNILLFSLIFTLIFSTNTVSFAASSSACKNETIINDQSASNDVLPLSVYSRTFTATYKYGTNTIKVTAYGTVRDEVANESSFYITGFQKIKISNVSGWQSVQSTGEIVSVSYGNNHQQAIMKFKFKASIGSGYEDYTGTVIFNL